MAVSTYSYLKPSQLQEFGYCNTSLQCNFACGDMRTTLRPARYNIRDTYPTGYHNLPVKVLLNIFGHFDEMELRKCLMPVCRKWKSVAQLPELWQRLRFKGGNVPPNFMCQQLRMLCNLQSVHLVNIPDAVTVIRQLCRCNPRLTSVGIKECSDKLPQGKLPESVLRNLVASCKKLQEIDLKGTQFCGNQFYLEVAVLPDIKSINLSKNQFLHGKNLLELALNCRTLEELKLTHRFKNQNLSDCDLQYLFCNLRGTLKSLSFDGIGIPDISFKLIFECVSLEKLLLYNAMNMSTESFISIAQKLPNLKFLKVQKLTVSPEAYVELFKLGKFTLRNITTLNLTDCWRLDFEGIKMLSECCKSLEKLVLKNCREITSIDPILENCKKLTWLNIAFCKKLDDKHIKPVPRKLSDLDTLYVDVLNEERRKLLENMKKEFRKLEIVMCLSEFNNITQELKNR